jgi:hypothetical protein
MERFKRHALPEVSPAGLSSHSRLRAAPHNKRCAVMREVLVSYLSPLLVDSVLEQSLAARRLSASSLTEDELAELASDAMVGLRLFVDEQLLAQLMLDLAEVLGPP